MKVIVSHSDRQYCNQLLVALAERKWLVRFYTIFSANKLDWLRPLFPRRLRQMLRKRAVDIALTPFIRHFPRIFLADRFLRKNLYWSIQHSYRWFDRRVAGKLKTEHFDFVITYENANLETLKTAKALGKTTVLDLAQVHHNDVLKYGRWFMSVENLEIEELFVNPQKAEALKYTDYILTLSSLARESVIQNGWPAERVFTANLGIDPEQFKPKAEYRQTGPLRLLFAGTLTKRKGLEVLFEALKGLDQSIVELTLIGPMADADKLLTRYVGRYRRLPFQHHENLVRHYQEADVFVFPSLLDSWAQTVLEAMACGTPAIVSENTGAKDAARQGGGWVIPVNDSEALRQIILSCLKNRNQLELCGRQAAATAKQYTWASYRRQVISILTEIARREEA